MKFLQKLMEEAKMKINGSETRE